jgi:hypothetical protein
VKISHIGHAAILIETRGVRLLSDPWWEGPCFGAQWWLHPAADLAPLREAPPDFIYISHGHSDHLHAGTLRRLPKSAKVIVSSASDLAAPIAQMGFEVSTLAPRERREIAPGVRVEITPTCGDDTLMVVDDGDEVCLNLNDALHAAPHHVRRDMTHYLIDRYLDRELAVLLRKQITPPRSRFGEQPLWLYQAKQKIGRAMGRRPNTLYDLAAWTVVISAQLG